MKRCTKCGTEKLLTEFGWTQGRYRSQCKACHVAVTMRSYHKNKHRYVERAKAARRRICDLIDAAKAVPCEDCGKSYPPYVMDFDHRPGVQKNFDVSSSRASNRSLQGILDEMVKCDVVCSNCHRERTHQRRNVAKR